MHIRTNQTTQLIGSTDEEEEDPNIFFLFAETLLFIDCGMINSTIDKGPFFAVSGWWKRMENTVFIEWMIPFFMWRTHVI